MNNLNIQLRAFLEQREKELTEQVSDIHRHLAPLEAELAEIRRAKVAIGMSPPNAVLAALENLNGGVATALPPSSRGFAEAMRSAIETPPSPYASMTMKQLIVKVLSEHFHQGATTRQMLDFVRDAWGRDIERTNLSPQISRLYQEGVIGRSESTKEWYLVPEARRGRKPYRRQSNMMSCGQIIATGESTVWLLPNEVRACDEPIPQAEVPEPNPDED